MQDVHRDYKNVKPERVYGLVLGVASAFIYFFLFPGWPIKIT